MLAERGGEYVLVNVRSGRALVERLAVLRAGQARLCELLGRRWLERGEGVRFLAGDDACGLALRSDLLLLDAAGTVLHVVHTVSPFALPAGGAQVHSAVELPPGSLRSVETQAGDVLEMYRIGELPGGLT